MSTRIGSLLLAAMVVSAAAQVGAGQFQVDLVFPKNKTYIPMGYFPVIYAIHNLDIAEPLNLEIQGTMKTHRLKTFHLDTFSNTSDRAFWLLPAGYDGFLWRDESRGANPFFFIAATSPMTNHSETHFHIDWTAAMNNCTDSDKEMWISENRHLEFSVAPDGEIPDIAAEIRSCEHQSVAVDLGDVQELKFPKEEAMCGTLDVREPTGNCDVMSQKADEVAANVSKLILGLSRCEEGPWQEIRTACESETSSGWRRSIAWLPLVLGVSLGFAVI